MAKRTPKSPYQKYGKTPHIYSIAYREWKSAVKAHGACDQKTLALSCQHAKAFGVTAKGCEGR